MSVTKGDLDAALTPFKAAVKAEFGEVKADLGAVKERVGALEENLAKLTAMVATLPTNDDIARHIRASEERFRTWFGALDDEYRPVLPAQQQLRDDLDAHANDATVHRAPRKRAR